MSNEIDLSDVIDGAGLDESYPYVISRSSDGEFVAGGWSEARVQLYGYGVVSTPSGKELEMIPEADRAHELRTFHSTRPLYTTQLNPVPGMTSDILIWNGVKFRVLIVRNYSNRGYWKAIAARMVGA